LGIFENVYFVEHFEYVDMLRYKPVKVEIENILKWKIVARALLCKNLFVGFNDESVSLL
jgi:hypothetical protein